MIKQSRATAVRLAAGVAVIIAAVSSGGADTKVNPAAKPINAAADDAFDAHDYALAAKKYRQASDLGSGYGSGRLCAMYAMGLGVAKNIPLAVSFCKKGIAINRDGNAMMGMGLMAATGDIPGGQREAITWLTRAIDTFHEHNQPQSEARARAMLEQHEAFVRQHYRQPPRDCMPYVEHTFEGDIGNLVWPCGPFS